MAHDDGLETALRQLHGTPDDAWLARCEAELVRGARRPVPVVAGATAVALAVLLIVLGSAGSLDGAGFEGVRTVEAEPLCRGLGAAPAPAVSAAAPRDARRCPASAP